MLTFSIYDGDISPIIFPNDIDHNPCLEIIGWDNPEEIVKSTLITQIAGRSAVTNLKNIKPPKLYPLPNKSN